MSLMTTRGSAGPNSRNWGFDYDRAARDPLHPPLPRPAFVALEYNGAAWEKWLNSPQRPKVLGSPLEVHSRLFPVDVAKTPEPLFRKYPARGRYLIVRGVVQLSSITRQEQIQLLPSISQILPDSIHVPLPLSNSLDLVVGTNPSSPRYTVTLSYGRSFEPWLVGLNESAKN